MANNDQHNFSASSFKANMQVHTCPGSEHHSQDALVDQAMSYLYIVPAERFMIMRGRVVLSPDLQPFQAQNACLMAIAVGSRES